MKKSIEVIDKILEEDGSVCLVLKRDGCCVAKQWFTIEDFVRCLDGESFKIY